jgi:hypothetical protein
VAYVNPNMICDRCGKYPTHRQFNVRVDGEDFMVCEGCYETWGKGMEVRARGKVIMDDLQREKALKAKRDRLLKL